MSALLKAVETGELRCSRCREVKPVGAFYKSRSTGAPTIGYCKACMSAYGRERYRRAHPTARLRGKPKHGPAAPPVLRVVAPSPAPAVIAPVELPADVAQIYEHRLHEFLAKVYAEGGFTAVQRIVESARSRLAAAHQADIAREGWIV